jgi:hypothetical protein
VHRCRPERAERRVGRPRRGHDETCSAEAGEGDERPPQADRITQRFRNDRQPLDARIAESAEHVVGERARGHPVEENIVGDEEGRVDRLETGYPELVPGRRADPAQVKASVANLAGDLRLDIRPLVPGGVVDHAHTQRASGQLRDLLAEILEHRRRRIILGIHVAETEYDGGIRPAGLVGSAHPVARGATGEHPDGEGGGERRRRELPRPSDPSHLTPSPTRGRYRP